MVGILDIEPITEMIDIVRPGDDGQEIAIKLTVRGFTLREWAVLVRRFPHLDAGAIAAPAAPASEADRVADILENLDVSKAVIAVGLGQPGNAEIEAAIEERLTEDEIKRVFDTVIRLSRPQPRPLPAGEAERSRSPRESPRSGKGPASTSSSSSMPLLAADISAPT